MHRTNAEEIYVGYWIIETTGLVSRSPLEPRRAIGPRASNAWPADEASNWISDMFDNVIANNQIEKHCRQLVLEAYRQLSSHLPADIIIVHQNATVSSGHKWTHQAPITHRQNREYLIRQADGEFLHARTISRYDLIQNQDPPPSRNLGQATR